MEMTLRGEGIEILRKIRVELTPEEKKILMDVYAKRRNVDKLK